MMVFLGLSLVFLTVMTVLFVVVLLEKPEERTKNQPLQLHAKPYHPEGLTRWS